LPGEAAHDHDENKQEQREREEINQPRLVVWSFFSAGLPFLRVDRHRLDDVVDAATDAAGEIVDPKAGNDGILYD
jgi:hypothetical protein